MESESVLSTAPKLLMRRGEVDAEKPASEPSVRRRAACGVAACAALIVHKCWAGVAGLVKLRQRRSVPPPRPPLRPAGRAGRVQRAWRGCGHLRDAGQVAVATQLMHKPNERLRVIRR